MARIDNGIDVSLQSKRTRTWEKQEVVKIDPENGLESKSMEKVAVITTIESSAATSFWVILGLLVAGFFIGQFVAGIVMLIFIVANGGGVELLSDPNALYENISQAQLLISQSLYTIVFTIAVPWFYMKQLAKKPLGSFFNESKVEPIPFLLALFSTVAFILVNGYIIEWNANINLPEFMSGFEEWAKELEQSMAETTKLFTTFNSFGAFALAFIVVAVIPGIGEELLFRGLLQNSLHRWTKNTHIAIWASAFIFSAIHLQFYGLFPRMALGALFGYLYVWSGNLWYPIIAHIANNGISLTVAYLFQLEIIEVDPDDPETMPIEYSIGGLLVCSVLLFLFRNYYLKAKSTP
ncbi:MAG: membrane protease YdiL (CAAX protease family) [Roseivirga sp.]|jgi:membrane protease YdiL (CAAX protease family)